MSDPNGRSDASSGPLQIGSPLPGFKLRSVDDGDHSLPAIGEASASVVIWTCNHCPYALGWHPRLVDVARDYTDRGVRVYFVNSNDAERYPDDSFEAMASRVEADGRWPAPYLHDESQAVARAYGALTTPDVFVADSGLRLRYRGAPDADYRDEALRAEWLRAALDSVIAGLEPDLAETDPVGCSIKWR